MKSPLLKITILLVILATGLSGCLFGTTPTATVKVENFTLEVWGVFDTSAAYAEIIRAYSELHPNITINYKQLRWEEYEQALLEGWAEDKGPDVFLVHNSWLGKYQTKITPLPALLSVPRLVETQGALKKTTKVVVDNIKTPTLTEIKNLFVPAVYADAVRDNQIWGLPLSVDSLVLFYNRTLLNISGITRPPSTWAELLTATKNITRTQNGKIVRSGVALGTADNNNRVVDVLSLLMMQQGAIVVAANGRATVDNERAEKALAYYLSFSGNPALSSDGQPLSYTNNTWNDGLAREATDAFIQGKLAMMFGYDYQLPFLRAQAPQLDIGVAAAPHLKADGSDIYDGQSINLANYWLLSAAKKTKHINEAWDFIRFAALGTATDPATGKISYRAESYLLANEGLAVKLKSPALLALVEKYKEDERFQPSLNQLLTAGSWYRGQNPSEMENVFKQMVDGVIYQNKEIRQVVSPLTQVAQWGN
ncbi:MAG: extracellular solute-binding protein [Patescibacteria group bacterium]|nr:extracellular solute-binding protein [Patescibacteria group bacterium]